jgi:hypothetical protein
VLTGRGLTTYLPVFSPCDDACHELLFPRYLFVYCDLAAGNNDVLHSTPFRIWDFEMRTAKP